MNNFQAFTASKEERINPGLECNEGIFNARSTQVKSRNRISGSSRSAYWNRVPLLSPHNRNDLPPFNL